MQENATLLVAFSAAFLVAAPAAAHAETPSQGVPTPSPWGFGARVGGYGFREAAPEGGTSWEDCRMSGMGLFAEHRLTSLVFVEGGLDQYFADDPAVMDRVSTTVTIAGGLRMLSSRWISLHVQLGAGLELTRVSMDEHSRSDALPVGFLGFGADARLYRGLRAGANVRLHGMGHYDHHDPVVVDEMDVSPELASQGQVYLRYDL